MQEVTISVGLFNAIMKYLETKPFNEVSPMFSEVQKELTERQQAQQVTKPLPEGVE